MDCCLNRMTGDFNYDFVNSLSIRLSEFNVVVCHGVLILAVFEIRFMYLQELRESMQTSRSFFGTYTLL